MVARDRHKLGLAPTLLYPAKAALTHARSHVWKARGAPRTARGIRILFYHRVSDDRDELAVTPRAFAAQMAALEDMGLRGVSIARAVELLEADRDDEAVVGLSFDDAYLDVAEHAHPVLERHGFSASVFVTTGVTDGRARFSWYQSQPPVMSWATIGELDGGAFEFEPHTVTHPNLLTLDHASATREIVDSKVELEARLGHSTSVFCYPAGLFGEREQRLARECGLSAAVSCEPGVNLSSTNRFALRRVQVDARDSVLDVRAKAAGAHDAPLPLRAAWRRLRYGMPSSRS